MCDCRFDVSQKALNARSISVRQKTIVHRNNAEFSLDRVSEYILKKGGVGSLLGLALPLRAPAEGRYL